MQRGKAFLGKWRMVEMDAFDDDHFEVEGPAYIEIEKARLGRSLWPHVWRDGLPVFGIRPPAGLAAW